MKVVMMIFGFILMYSTSLFASGDVIGVIKSVKNPANIERNQKLISVKTGDKLFVRDALVTGQNGAIGVILKDDSLISIGSNSRLIINEFLLKPEKKELSFVASVIKGTMVCLTGLIAKLDRDAVQVKTPTATIGVRGTHFAVRVEE
jgi:hypothetical protein